jgi:small subunit ribosomal protein S11
MIVKSKFKNILKKKKKILIAAHLYIKSSLKNTIISLTKTNGNLLKQWSTKSLKKTKFKKNTPYNVQLIAYQLNKYIKLKKIKKLNIFLNGKGLGRYNILRNLKKPNLKIGYLVDKTPIPFNGCRKKKMKRR